MLGSWQRGICSKPQREEMGEDITQGRRSGGDTVGNKSPPLPKQVIFPLKLLPLLSPSKVSQGDAT